MAAAIYVIINKVNNKIYIGSSVDVEQRWKDHDWALNAGKHVNPHLQSAWFKYGPSAFEFKVIEAIEDPNKTLEREQVYLDIYFNTEPERLYNIKRNAHGGGQPLSDEAKQSISEKNREVTSEQEEQAIKMYAEDKTQLEISKTLGLNKMTIVRLFNRLEKEGRLMRKKDLRKKQVLELYAKGMKQKDIAAELGISTSSVSQLVNGGYKRKE